MFFEMRSDLAHWTQVSDRCPLGYLFFKFSDFFLLLLLLLWVVGSGDGAG